MKKLTALTKLLFDPDRQVSEAAQAELLKMGSQALPTLRNLLFEVDDVNEDIVIDLVEIIELDLLAQDFSLWAEQDEPDLLDLMHLIIRLRDENADKNEFIARIVRIKLDIWLAINDQMSILDKVRVVNKVFFDDYGFQANIISPMEECNFFVDHLLATREGNDTSLGVLYLYFAQALKLPFFGVYFLPNFILACTTNAEENSIEDVLFYVNPYRKGITFSRQNLMDHFSQAQQSVPYKDITPCSNLRIAKRWLTLIKLVAQHEQDSSMMKKTSRLQEILSHV